MTVEEVYRDRDKFASLVRDVASPDVGRMGIEIISFTIRDISDKVGYLSALGKAQTAIVKRDANIGVAEANRDAGIKEAEAEREAKNFKYMTDSKIGKNENMYNLQVSEFEKEIQTAQAGVALAYELQTNILAQKIKEAEVKVTIVERKKLIEVEKNEVIRKELELTSLIRLPAEAEAFELETISEGKKIEKIAEASASAEKIKLLGNAEAFKVSKIGEAEANGMLKKAKVFTNYNAAAKLALITNSLPLIASTVSAPLSKIDEILYLGRTNEFLDNVNALFGKIPPSLRTIAGIDVINVLQSRLNASKKNNDVKFNETKS